MRRDRIVISETIALLTTTDKTPIDWRCNHNHDYTRQLRGSYQTATIIGTKCGETIIEFTFPVKKSRCRRVQWENCCMECFNSEMDRNFEASLNNVQNSNYKRSCIVGIGRRDSELLPEIRLLLRPRSELQGMWSQSGQSQDSRYHLSGWTIDFFRYLRTCQVRYMSEIINWSEHYSSTEV